MLCAYVKALIITTRLMKRSQDKLFIKVVYTLWYNHSDFCTKINAANPCMKGNLWSRLR